MSAGEVAMADGRIAPAGGPEAAGTGGPGRGRSGRLAGWRLAALLLALAAVAVPFLAVDFPPITDLPQQAAQIRLAGEALADPGSPYRIQWTTPYLLSYLLIGVGWLAGGPLAAGRLGMLLIVALWVVAAHALAADRDRSAAAALLASTLAFNNVVYWGFYSFAVGWPLFVLWLALTARPPRRDRPWREAALGLGGAALLYFAHALWLAAGGLWLAVWTLAARHPPRSALPRFAGMAPVLALAAAWFHGLRQTPFATPASYLADPLERLSLDWLTYGVYGGLRGRVEEVFLLLLLGWLLAAVLGHRGRLAVVVDRPLALAGAMFVLLALTLPDKYTNTIQFEQRWLPGAMTLLVLAVPAPRRGRRALAAAAAAALTLFAAATTVAWHRFERDEMSGLGESLAALEALPDEPRVLGLAFLRDSRWIEGKPFLQTFAYAQVVRGGELNFSFAEFAPSLVVWRQPPKKPWTPSLEWLPEELRVSDLRWFDQALIGTDEAMHRRFTADPALDPLTREGVWRLYRIDQEEVAAALARLRSANPPPKTAVPD